jgi:RTX calcium-binding nonapeptide repeat (4 copies)
MTVNVASRPHTAIKAWRLVSTTVVWVLALTGLGIVPASATPVNDDFADALRLLGSSGVYEADGSGASCERGEVHYGVHIPRCPSLWFSWTAPATGELHVQARGMDTPGPPAVIIYRGDSLSALTEEIFSRGDSYGTESSLETIVLKGVDYRFAVLDYYYVTVALQWDLFPNPCTILGTNRPDVITATPGPDHICGLGGDDLISGEEGSDVIDGGGGFDTITYAGSPHGVHAFVGINWGIGTATGWGNDDLRFVEGVIGSRYPDVLEGGGGDDRESPYHCANTFVGGKGNDVLIGNWDADRLFGGDGDDQLFLASSFRGIAQIANGGDGVDTVSYGRSRKQTSAGYEVISHLRLSLASGVATASEYVVTASRLSDVLVGIENARGSNNDDVIVGSEGDNVLRGDYGGDTIYGRGGDDLVLGEQGNDSLDGGPGHDTCGQGAGTGTESRCESRERSR